MADDQNQQQPKGLKGLFAGLVSKAAAPVLDKAAQAAAAAAQAAHSAQQRTAPPAAPPQAPAPGPARSGPLAPAGRPPAAPGSDKFQGSITQPIGGPLSKPLAPLEADKSPEEKAKESKDRQTFISSYKRNPRLIPEFSDQKFVYKIVTDERSYQKERLDTLQAELKRIVLDPLAFDPEDPQVQAKRAELEAQINEANNHMTNLFLLLKQVTGITKKTGGTNFLGTDQLPPVPPT